MSNPPETIAEIKRIRIPDEEASKIEAFLRPFVEAGPLVPILCRQLFEGGRQWNMLPESTRELFQNTQAIIAKFLQDETPVLFNALRELRDGNGDHAIVLENIPTTDGVETPKGEFTGRHRTQGILSDYLGAGISLILGKSVANIASQKFHDVVDDEERMASGGRHIHNDSPESFFMLHCQEGNPEARTFVHDLSLVTNRLSAHSANALTREGLLIKDGDALQLSTTEKITINSAGEYGDESIKSALYELLRLLKPPEAQRQTALKKGDLLLVDARYCLHSVGPYAFEQPPRWLARASLQLRDARTTCPVPEGACFAAPWRLSKEKLLASIALFSRLHDTPAEALAL